MSDTRRRVSRTEFYPAGVDPAQVDVVLQALSGPQARLIVAGGWTVEIAHEALIQQWDDLRNWLEADREALRTHRRLTEAAQEWERRGRDESYLYHSARLSAAEERAEAHADDPNILEREFLEASVEAREAVRIAARRQVKRAIAGLVAALMILAGLAFVAFQQRNNAEAQRLKAEHQSRIAQSLALAAYAEGVIDQELAVLLGLEAVYQTHQKVPGKMTAEACSALHRAMERSRWQATLWHTDAV